MITLGNGTSSRPWGKEHEKGPHGALPTVCPQARESKAGCDLSQAHNEEASVCQDGLLQ